MQKLFRPRALSNSPSATRRPAFSSLQTLNTGPFYYKRGEKYCRTLQQPTRVACLTYDGSRRHSNSLGLDFPLRSRGSSSEDEQRPVKCEAATAGADALGSYGEAGSGGQGFGAGIAKDVERRLPHYPSDFTDGLHPKTFSAVVYMVFASLAPCFAFGGSVTLSCWAFAFLFFFRLSTVFLKPRNLG